MIRNRKGMLCAILLLSCAAACAAPMKNAVVVPPGTAITLADDEGLLVMQIDTDVPLEHVQLTSGPAASALPKGRHLWIVRVRAGRYAWKEVRMGSQAGADATHRMRDISLLRDDEFDFEVLPGTISYPGELIVRTSDFYRSSGFAWIRNRNHSAMAVRRLDKTHGELLDLYPIRHTGWSEDGFLEFYTERRHSVASGRESK